MKKKSKKKLKTNNHSQIAKRDGVCNSLQSFFYSKYGYVISVFVIVVLSAALLFALSFSIGFWIEKARYSTDEEASVMDKYTHVESTSMKFTSDYLVATLDFNTGKITYTELEGNPEINGKSMISLIRASVTFATIVNVGKDAFGLMQKVKNGNPKQKFATYAGIVGAAIGTIFGYSLGRDIARDHSMVKIKELVIKRIGVFDLWKNPLKQKAPEIYNRLLYIYNQHLIICNYDNNDGLQLKLPNHFILVAYNDWNILKDKSIYDEEFDLFIEDNRSKTKTITYCILNDSITPITLNDLSFYSFSTDIDNLNLNYKFEIDSKDYFRLIEQGYSNYLNQIK